MTIDTGTFSFDRGRNMIFDLESFANNRTMIVDLEGFANLTDTFSANLTIDFGSWTKSGGTYTFSDNDPGTSTSLNFSDKTVNEVVGLIDDITGFIPTTQGGFRFSSVTAVNYGASGQLA